MENKNASRLGKILLDKGIITQAELNIAVREQAKRRLQLDPSDPSTAKATALGEVLIELGFINQLELKRGLSWQKLLRKVTLAMTLCAPLMTLGTGAAAATSSSSGNKTAATYNLPLTIQAEDYTDMFGIQTEATTDTGGGLNVGYFHEKDWLSYANIKVVAPVSGEYKITYRVASINGGGSFALQESDGSKQYDVVNVPATGGSQKWITIEHTVTLTAGTHSFGLTTLTRGSGFNINWFKIDVVGMSLPVTIQAEAYSDMYGVQTQTTSDTGGGLNVGYIHEKDWMNYANQIINIPTTGSYKVTFRLASAGGGGTFAFREADGSKQYDVVPVPNTGGTQKWINVERTITLSAGAHRFGITALTRGNGYNINWFKVESAGTATGNSPVPTVSSSSSSSKPSVASSAASSKPATPLSSSSASSAPANTSSVSSAPSSTVTTIPKSSSSSSAASGHLSYKWNIPSARENGDYLDVTEIGGYEVRYRLATDSHYTYITINDPWQNYYEFNWLEGDYVVQVAAFDKEGLYSDFVDLEVH